jgi:hypothetical protein
MKIFSVILLLVAFGSSPPSLALGQAPDTQGSQILEQVIATAGGRQAWNQMKDFQASGTLALYSAGLVMDRGEATMLGSGLKRFRLTATLEHETRTWLWKDGTGVVTTSNGLGGAIGRHNLVVLEGITLPIQRVIAILDGPSRSVQMVESSLMEGKGVYRIRIMRTASDRQEAMAFGRASYGTDVLVDQQTFTILALEDSIHPNDNDRDVFSHRVTYGDYRVVSGVQIPFTVKEEIAGQLTWGLQIQSFVVNPGLTGSEFMLK